MAMTIDYYFAPNSPWTYLGHQRFTEIAKAAGAKVNVLPVDLGGQAYRLVELKRFSEYLHQPMNLQPAFFPVNPDDAAQLIIAVDLADGTDAAMALTGRILRGVWVDQKNLADQRDLAAMLVAEGLPARRLDDAMSQAVHERYELDSQRAIEAGVFGAPSYVIAGEIFWGQDRLDFVQRRLAAG
jgi:2-hydroxychromene-2-carboxylate isomerase